MPFSARETLYPKADRYLSYNLRMSRSSSTTSIFFIFPLDIHVFQHTNSFFHWWQPRGKDSLEHQP